MIKKYIASVLGIALLFVAVSANAQTVFLPRQGGTGTGSVPSYGKLLVGTASGVYTLTSTSSLGLPTFSDLSSYVASSRNVNTTYPVTGGGALSSDLTLGLAFGTTTANSWSALQTFGNASSTILSAGTLCLTGDTCITTWPTGSGSGFSTTSADYWESTQTRWATTSSDYWQTQRNFFSTTSAAYWETTQWRWATTSADYWESTKARWATTSADYWKSVTTFTGASTTLLANNNTWTGLNVFGNASSSAFTNTGSTWLTALATPAGTVLAVDPNGKVIATTTAAGGVTAVTGTWPILSTGGATPVISWGGLSTTTNLTAGQVVYASGAGSITSVASSSLTFSGPFSGYSGLGALIGGSNSTVTWTGLATTSQPSSSNLLVSNGAAGVYGVATSTLTPSYPITGSFVQLGSGGSLSLAFGTTTANSWSALQTISAATTTDLSAVDLWLTGITSKLLATDSNGLVSATTSIGTNLLTGVLAIANGGTNASTQVTNGVNFYNGTSITSSSTLIYTSANRLALGTSTPWARFSIHANANEAYFPTLFEIASSTASATTSLFRINNTSSASLLIGTSTGATGIQLDVYQATATSSIRVDSGTTKGGCIVLKDSDGSGYTYVTAANGTLSASATSCL